AASGAASARKKPSAAAPVERPIEEASCAPCAKGSTRTPSARHTPSQCESGRGNLTEQSPAGREETVTSRAARMEISSAPARTRGRRATNVKILARASTRSRRGDQGRESHAYGIGSFCGTHAFACASVELSFTEVPPTGTSSTDAEPLAS